jgi:hypothetical protein
MERPAADFEAGLPVDGGSLAMVGNRGEPWTRWNAGCVCNFVARMCKLSAGVSTNAQEQ